MALGLFLLTDLCTKRMLSFIIIWYIVLQLSSCMILDVLYRYELKPNMGREHFMISTCSLDGVALLLDISMHAA